MIAAATGVAAAAISVSPVRVRLAASASRTVVVRNGGTAVASIDARIAGFVLDRRGKPVVARASRVVAPPVAAAARARAGRGGRAHGLVQRACRRRPRRSSGARPADDATVDQGAAVAIRMRIGVVVFVRVPGRIVHRLELGPPRVRDGVLEAAVANRGNVVERPRLRVSLWRRGHLLLVLGSRTRTLLPHSTGIERFRCRGSVHGRVVVQVEAGAVRRAFWIQV